MSKRMIDIPLRVGGLLCSGVTVRDGSVLGVAYSELLYAAMVAKNRGDVLTSARAGRLLNNKLEESVRARILAVQMPDKKTPKQIVHSIYGDAALQPSGASSRGTRSARLVDTAPDGRIPPKGWSGARIRPLNLGGSRSSNGKASRLETEPFRTSAKRRAVGGAGIFALSPSEEEARVNMRTLGLQVIDFLTEEVVHLGRELARAVPPIRFLFAYLGLAGSTPKLRESTM